MNEQKILEITYDILKTVNHAYYCNVFGAIKKANSTKEQVQKCFEKLIDNGDIIIDRELKMPQLTIQGKNLLYDVEKVIQTQLGLKILITNNIKGDVI